MTALAVALVLCCAMVCGTVLALKRPTAQHADVATLYDLVKTLDGRQEGLRDDCAKVRAEVEQLRASSAFRSLT